MLGQSPAAYPLSGTVRDESGGVMQAVPILVFDETEEASVREVVTDSQGRFRLSLPPGRYRVEASILAFAPFTQVVTVGPDTPPLDIRMKIDVVGLEVEVSPSDQLVADTSMSLTSTTLSGDDLLDLPRTEEDLTEYLLSLAGGESSGDLEADILANFVIDGFEDGRLPSPDQIAQIIIDPNSLRADGQGPRIEIITRPGSGRWRGSVEVGFADESLNARTPGEIRKEPRQTRDVELDARGPLVPNVLEVDAEFSSRTDERAGESLRAITPNGELFSGVVQPEEERDIELGARLQLNARHRVDVQFVHETEDARNQGIGGFRLPERGSNEESGRWRVQVSERMFTPTLNNNIRFQVDHLSSREVPLREGFAIDVADAFMAGGGTSRSSRDDLSLRLDDNLRWTRGTWSFRWEGQLRYQKRRTVDRDNYNGTYEFASLHDYCAATGFAGVNCAATARIVGDAAARGIEPVYFDARGVAVPITGRPTTFTQAFGNADLTFSQLSFETSLQADKRLGDRASLGLGLQYTATNHSLEFLRVNPTINVQYRLTDATVVSAGARLEFQDFADRERLLRNDGSTYETERSISSPSFPDPFQGGTEELDSRAASVWVLSPDYTSPYTVSPQFSVTQQLGASLRLSVSYTASYGTHQRRTRNINAPLPGTPLPDEILELPVDERREVIDRMRPMYPHVGNVTQIETTGRSASRTTRVRLQQRRGLELAGLEFSGSFDYSFQTTEDDNDFNIPYARAWGPTRRDHQVQTRFRVGLPERVRFEKDLLTALARATYEGVDLNFNLRSHSGRLYSIVTGRDLNGDQSTRDRPPGIGRNTEVGPANWNLDLTLTKNIPVLGGGGIAAASAQGRGGEGGGRRNGSPGGGENGSRLRFQARVRNLLNRSQPRAYGSVLTSPLFGLPTGYTGGRTIDLSMRVEF